MTNRRLLTYWRHDNVPLLALIDLCAVYSQRLAISIRRSPEILPDSYALEDSMLATFVWATYIAQFLAIIFAGLYVRELITNPSPTYLRIATRREFVWRIALVVAFWAVMIVGTQLSIGATSHVLALFAASYAIVMAARWFIAWTRTRRLQVEAQSG